MSRAGPSRAGPAFSSPYYEFEVGSLLHLLLHHYFDFVGDRVVHWNMGPGVFNSDRPTEWCGLCISASAGDLEFGFGFGVAVEDWAMTEKIDRFGSRPVPNLVTGDVLRHTGWMALPDHFPTI